MKKGKKRDQSRKGTVQQRAANISRNEQEDKTSSEVERREEEKRRKEEQKLQGEEHRKEEQKRQEEEHISAQKKHRSLILTCAAGLAVILLGAVGAANERARRTAEAAEQERIAIETARIAEEQAREAEMEQEETSPEQERSEESSADQALEEDAGSAAMDPGAGDSHGEVIEPAMEGTVQEVSEWDAEERPEETQEDVSGKGIGEALQASEGSGGTGSDVETVPPKKKATSKATGTRSKRSGASDAGCIGDEGLVW